MVRVGLVEPQPRQALAVDEVDAAAEQAVAQAQRIAVHRDQHDVGQQGDHRRRIEMLPARQPVRRVDALPVAKQRPGAGMERRGVDGIVISAGKDAGSGRCGGGIEALRGGDGTQPRQRRRGTFQDRVIMDSNGTTAMGTTPGRAGHGTGRVLRTRSFGDVKRIDAGVYRLWPILPIAGRYSIAYREYSGALDLGASSELEPNPLRQ